MRWNKKNECGGARFSACGVVVARMRVRVVCGVVVLCAVLGSIPRPGSAVCLPEADGDSNELTPTKVSEAPAEPAVHERFPHAVLLGGTCGGTVISDRWVLSAAHCTISSSASFVVAGTSRATEGGVTRNVARLVVHPRFAVGPFWLQADLFNISQVGARWDFLLAELEEPLPLDGKSIAAVTLDDQAAVPAGLDAAYAGFGAERHGEVMRNEMHAMALQTQPDKACARLEQFSAEDMFCAGGRAPKFDSACNGDSGSGLVTEGAGPRRLVGVASWVEGDARECRPGALVVFARVSAVRKWIRQVTGI